MHHNSKTLKFYGMLVTVMLCSGLLAKKLYDFDRQLPAINSINLHKPLPQLAQFGLTDRIMGRTITLNDFPKQPFLLHFWASWCQTCVEELPELYAISKKYNIPIVSILFRDSAFEITEDFAKINPFNIVAYDMFGKFAVDLGVKVIPTTFLVDREHYIRYAYAGFISTDTWQQQLLPIWQSIS